MTLECFFLKCSPVASFDSYRFAANRRFGEDRSVCAVHLRTAPMDWKRFYCVEWREGITPSRSHRSGRDSLPSSDSYHPAHDL